MGKISKKYIGPDQVGSVQLELENALSLRAKAQDGVTSVDLLEYSADDVLVVQQDLHVLANKSIISDSALGAAFIIGTSLGADMVLEPGTVTGASNGGITYIRGGGSDTGVAGSIYLQPGQDSFGLKGTIQVEAGSFVLQNSCPISMLSSGSNFLNISESADFASSYGIKASNYDLVMYTNNQADAATNSFKVSLITGNAADGNSGDINITTGSASGDRGTITLDALEVQCSSMQFKDAADPTDAQDLATKAYVDAQISAGTTCDKQSITLLAGDISAQYVDLNEQFVPESLFVGVGQRVNLYETLDYNLSIVGGVTRLTFAGPSATGGAEALVEGDILYIQGIVDLSP